MLGFVYSSSSNAVPIVQPANLIGSTDNAICDPGASLSNTSTVVPIFRRLHPLRATLAFVHHLHIKYGHSR